MKIPVPYRLLMASSLGIGTSTIATHCPRVILYLIKGMTCHLPRSLDLVDPNHLCELISLVGLHYTTVQDQRNSKIERSCWWRTQIWVEGVYTRVQIQSMTNQNCIDMASLFSSNLNIPHSINTASDKQVWHKLNVCQSIIFHFLGTSNKLYMSPQNISLSVLKCQTCISPTVLLLVW